jgi:glycosyltransferase involved in cell wall biosynthesis
MNNMEADEALKSHPIPNNHQPEAARRLRVLQVTGSLRRGGVETWLSQALVRLPRERFQCDICNYQFSGGAYAADLEKYGCHLHFIPRGSSPFALFRFSKKFRQLLCEGHYDVVHCHGLPLIGFLMLLAWLERVPVRIGHSHSTDRKTGGTLMRLLNRIGLALNRPLARLCSTQGVGCSAEALAAVFGKRWQEHSKYSIIHCGIDLAPFEAKAECTSWREALGIPPTAKVIGHVSNFSVAKNPFFLAEVAASVFRRRQDVVLLLVGDGALRSSVEKQCADIGITSHVIFAGVSSHIPELMCSAMDVFVLPSVYEGLPLVLLEAQAAGLPCVVSDVVSREAQVVDGAIQFLPLAAGPDVWGNAVLSKLETSAQRPYPLQVMKDTDFNVVVSARRLADLYDAAYASGATTA